MAFIDRLRQKNDIMKRSITSLIGYSIKAIDGEIGKIKEFSFDDETWTVRFLIVKTGNWLTSRKVLISPEALISSDWDKENFKVNLTREQIRNSPEIDIDKPFSPQQEIKIFDYYKVNLNGSGGIVAMEMKKPVKQPSDAEDVFTSALKSYGNNLLHNTRKVIGYTISAVDGTIGKINDFIFNDSNWKLDFMVVDNVDWNPEEKVIISPKRIKEIKWESSSVIVNTMVELVKDSPEYHPDLPIGEAYEDDLENHYDGFVCNKR
jgi:hypothetical protein